MPRHGFSLADIAARVGGDVFGAPADLLIRQVAPLSTAQQGEISFLANPKYRRQFDDTAASAVIVSPGVFASMGAQADRLACLVVQNPYATYARVAALLNPASIHAPGVHATAVLESPVPASTHVGPRVYVAPDARIGENVVLHTGCVIGQGAVVGDGSVVHPNVTVYPGCRVGQRNILHAGAVIGADGFGFAPDGKEWVKIPQIGVVVLGDDVEIGANTTIDRGALGDTRIGNGTKIDNLVQIGHNCQIGEHCVIAACAAIAGSVTLETHCVIGGAAMIVGHITIAGGSVVSGGTMVMKSITQAGHYTAVYPTDTHDAWVKNASHIRRLTKLADRVAALEKTMK